MCHYKKTKRWKTTYSSRLSQYITAGFDSLKKTKTQNSPQFPPILSFSYILQVCIYAKHWSHVICSAKLCEQS